MYVYVCSEESNWSAEEEEDDTYSVCVCSLCAVRRVTSRQNVRVCMYVWQTVVRKLSFNVQRENDLNHKIVSSKLGEKQTISL